MYKGMILKIILKMELIGWIGLFWLQSRWKVLKYVEKPSGWIKCGEPLEYLSE
jgi:hypothetical protein